MKTTKLELRDLTLLEAGHMEEIIYEDKKEVMTYTFKRATHNRTGDDCIECIGSDEKTTQYESAISCWNNDFNIISNEGV